MAAIAFADMKTLQVTGQVIRGAGVHDPVCGVVGGSRRIVCRAAIAAGGVLIEALLASVRFVSPKLADLALWAPAAIAVAAVAASSIAVVTAVFLTAVLLVAP